MTQISLSEEDIFQVARRIGRGEARAAYLNQACGEDVVLREEIEELLRAHDESQSFLESPASEIERGPGSPATLDHCPPEKLGALIGPYKLLEQIGEGGMGVVFVAEQTEPVRRRVALKIIKPGMDSKQVIARFEAERQALAMMDHPHIARVLDAGTTDRRASVPACSGTSEDAYATGRPYFVMELVRGMPITDYCDKVRLSPRQRLELFVDVCHAIQHAHQKGIIHRDLKPSNVLITLHDGKPVVKVIDFGVAKAVGQQLTERTIYTALTQLVGTPLYMSPEQAEMSGLDVDTRSDVYSLGVLLYELLTGQTPFDKEALSKAGFDEMRRMIREDEPPRPSRRLSTLGDQAISTASQHRGVDERRLSRILSGELDWIVMKALEKDRSRRYESASSLAADIQRYLSDEPVLACPPTTMYRFQKFARKHRPALVTAAAIAACLFLGTTVSAWQAVRATTAQAQANANANEAQEKAQEANTQRDEAHRQRDEVRALNERIQAAHAQQRSTVYTARVILAQRAWDANDPERAADALDQLRPQAGETDLRGFEWHYLNRLCHADLLTLKGHTGYVNDVAYSPDGKLLASSSLAGGWQGPGKVIISDAQTGQEIRTLQVGGQSVAFSPDGKRLASCDWNTPADVRIWDAQTGQSLLVIEGERDPHSVVFSPDGKRLATRSLYYMNEGKPVASEIKLWNAQTGEAILTIKHLSPGGMPPAWGHFSSVAFSPDGKRLATGESTRTSGESKLVKVWDAETGDLLTTTAGHAESIHSVAFSPDGKRVASASADKTVKVWDSESGMELVTFQGHSGTVWDATYSPDGKYVASAADDRTAKLWDAETGQELATLKGHSDWVGGLAFSPDGKRLASASGDKTVKVWDTPIGQHPLTLKGGVTSITSVAYSPDGKCLASLGLGSDRWVAGEGRVWDTQTGEKLFSLAPSDSIGPWRSNVTFSPDGKRILAGTDTGRAFPVGRFGLRSRAVTVWDAKSGEVLLSLQGHTKRIVSVAYSADGKWLASASIAQNYEETVNPPPNVAQIPGSAVQVWDALTGDRRLTLPGHADNTNCVAFSPDGTRVASGGRDEKSSASEVKIWDAQTGQELFTLQHTIGSSNGISGLVFSPDGRSLASSAWDDKIIKIWNAHTGQEVRAMKGHSAGLSGLAYSADGKRLASAANDKTVKLWDAQTGDELLTLEGHDGRTNGVTFSPDGHWLACGGPDGTIKIYDATPLPEKP